ncbi:molybdopterin-binding protein [Shimia marina]|uniref:Putative molybdopterin biosynthesis protein MoeA/LysR substrate binding-domain-containing protein n=1 Tax=Shimia marina TaxID=321267 RepID=A0A0P1EJC0_9RHOB|nr:molybdopterin-binding protein [Shimia marina]CUH50598.1 putative molybdopterin biosynthesis protein MoeA/LysR substrate binding-domain-containing protein [Shimia marina]SFE39329.1 molybdenum cofactor cytidylyltransferase [Shimia marina]
MKFGAVAIEEAVGAVLAHSLIAGKRIPKGTQLLQSHIEDLRAAGIAEVTVARLEDGDVDEDTAAETLAQAVLGASVGIRMTAAGAGRVNLYAERCGLIRVNIDTVHQINAVEPMITIATVPDHHRVDAGGMIATIKIIAYAVSDEALKAAASIAEGAVTLCRPAFKTATLIETTIGDVPSDKGRRAMAGRVERMEMGLTPRVLVPHTVADIASAVSSTVGDVIFILTASATSDPRDVAPEAVRSAGGEVERFGMPVDPGNLLFLGRIGDKPVIGLPGCARSSALNGADWVLERVVCGLDVSHDDIAAMGVGGLLKEIPTRPMPREKGI